MDVMHRVSIIVLVLCTSVPLIPFDCPSPAILQFKPKRTNDILTNKDLEPIKLLIASRSTLAEVKLADFGLSSVISDDAMLKTSCGTLTYCAPQILHGAVYGKHVGM